MVSVTVPANAIIPNIRGFVAFTHHRQISKCAVLHHNVFCSECILLHTGFIFAVEK